MKLKSVSIAFACLFLVVVVQGCSTGGDSTLSGGKRKSPPPDWMSEEAALIAEGKKQYIRCNACHSIRANEATTDPLGPHLESIIDRLAGGLEDYEYTDEVGALGFRWDEQRMDQWLKDPQEMIPGMCMPFTGMSDPQARKALIAFMKQSWRPN